MGRNTRTNDRFKLFLDSGCSLRTMFSDLPKYLWKQKLRVLSPSQFHAVRTHQAYFGPPILNTMKAEMSVDMTPQ